MTSSGPDKKFQFTYFLFQK